MKSAIRWAIDNAPAMNTLMVSVLVMGALAVANLRREVFPEFDLEIILVTVPYPGASPEEVEDGICQKIEEAVRSIDGIKKQTAVAKEGAGSMVLELKTGVDPKKVLAEVRSEIDRIPSFPLLADDPEVKQLTVREAVIQVGVVGPDVDEPEAERQLREIAERVRGDLIRLENISQATISGAKEYQIDVEIPEATLREHDLTLRKVAATLRRENFELPGGTIRTDSQDVLVKGDNKRDTGQEIARLPVISLPSGAKLTVGDLGQVRDEFADVTSRSRVDGRPAMVVSVNTTSSEDLLAATADVHAYCKDAALPPGYELVTWADRSVDVADRMNLLKRNGLQGLVLVLIVLAIFLNLRVAFWVALGIPISVLGACAVLWVTGETLNMLTMFAFLMALGIVVDDAIVIGENIFAHRQEGKPPLQAAVEGTSEVLPSVVTSVTTTVIAFMPLMFVSGIMGKFIACLPLAMIAMLLISLLESTFVLPCHLGHEANHDEDASRRSRFVRAFRWLGRQLLFPVLMLEKFTGRVNQWSNHLLDQAATRFYAPGLRWSITHPAIAISAAASLLLMALSLVSGGHVPFTIMPKLDSNDLEASMVYPDGTPAHVTERGVAVLDEAIRRLDRRYQDEGRGPILRLTRQSVGFSKSNTGPGQTTEAFGGHIGGLSVALHETSMRSVKSAEIILHWRELAQQLGGGFPGAESVVFKSAMGGPGGIPIEFKLLAPSEHVDELENAVEDVKQKLATYPGVFDIDDDSRPGKWEIKLRVKDRAVAMGVPLGDVAETVRAAYYGEEVMRLQRGRHEVKLMVRYPKEDRRSLADFDQIRVRGEDGAERPLTELADVELYRGLSEINRVDQLRSITVTADLDESQNNASDIVRDLRVGGSGARRTRPSDAQATQAYIESLLAKYPHVRIRWEGQQEQTRESLGSLFLGLGVALVAMFVVLTMEFRSYLQPLMILAIIPFGAVGAIAGHYVRDMPLSLFSMFGLVALTGVVVNDSIVLIDFINHRLREGDALGDALLEAGRRRLRPVLLTSMTTVAGLMPLLVERSFQAQILIPMAVSLSFGLMLATALVLFLIPTFYSVYGRVLGMELNLVATTTSAERLSPEKHSTDA
jgi:multidrug efflux pump subunit AcrB